MSILSSIFFFFGAALADFSHTLTLSHTLTHTKHAHTKHAQDDSVRRDFSGLPKLFRDAANILTTSDNLSKDLSNLVAFKRAFLERMHNTISSSFLPCFLVHLFPLVFFLSFFLSFPFRPCLFLSFCCLRSRVHACFLSPIFFSWCLVSTLTQCRAHSVPAPHACRGRAG